MVGLVIKLVGYPALTLGWIPDVRKNIQPDIRFIPCFFLHRVGSIINVVFDYLWLGGSDIYDSDPVSANPAATHTQAMKT